MTTEIEKELETSEAVLEKRRNFAIISHPDAGKTTLTEKLLLYGGAIHQAGAVKARRDQRKATSDWMEMEKQRGISITSTVLQFDYRDFQINLLDTPGHQDFSEDTYRTLAAADNARSHGSQEAQETVIELGDPKIEDHLEKDLYYQLKEDIELLSELGAELDLPAVHAGEMTPIFFGSAMTNFGVKLFLESFLDYGLPPRGRNSSLGVLDPTYPDFTGFVFKLQANMDPKHRDRVAFVRVCTGKFEKDMVVNHARTGKTIRLSRPQKLFAQDRAVIEEAYPGDVIGLNNPGVFAIGDTIYMGKKLEYEGIPCFSPELFAYLRNPNPSKFKQFQKGVSELQEEGAVQILSSIDEFKRDPILAAVGQLQFEVVQFRLLSEYGVETTLEPLAYSLARWVSSLFAIKLDRTGRIGSRTAILTINPPRQLPNWSGQDSDPQTTTLK